MPEAIQVARGLLQLYFALAEIAELNEQQKREMYEQEKQKFNERDPDKLTEFQAGY